VSRCSLLLRRVTVTALEPLGDRSNVLYDPGLAAATKAKRRRSTKAHDCACQVLGPFIVALHVDELGIFDHDCVGFTTVINESRLYTACLVRSYAGCYVCGARSPILLCQCVPGLSEEATLVAHLDRAGSSAEESTSSCELH
jgi:hypothetical protein